MVELPTKRKEIVEADPKLLLLYGLPKCGKSTIVADLPNALHLDLEPNGTDYVPSMSFKISSLEDILKVAEAIHSGKYNYDFVIVDTITELEDMCLPLAARKYRATSMGKNWNGNDVRTLASGGGYLYLRKAFMEVLSEIQRWAPYIILVGHLKEKIVDKNGTEVNIGEIDLIGKDKALVSARADAIGYVFRKDNLTNISFNNASEDVICGSRIQRIAGKIITVAESNDKGELSFDWTKIYSFLK